ncbi:DUF6597 domain-containing transcriptional factor [Paenibacillus sp. GCM10027629]|uniref:DUF6597 domain-containing transcriptional factor n=1 Tax=Paenibacillus sp. GCM10027629 TaxID=3273414 RepID=UPI0036373E72
MKPEIVKPSMGVLNLSRGTHKFQLTRHEPSEDIDQFVKHFWIVSWDLTEQAPYLQEVVPNPCVNLVIESNRSAIFGAAKQKYTHHLEGKGVVFGVKFKPGGFYPFIKQPISELANQPMRIQDVFDVEIGTLEQELLTQESESDMVRLAEQFIRPKLPPWDDQVEFINQIIDRVKVDREITKVDEICDLFHLNKRTLQRLFDQYVGVSPKWVIQLYRLQNAAETIEHQPRIDWSELSTELGYYDQSHFIKDFRTIIGKTPDEYVREQLK